MRHVREVLKEKELAIEQLRREIASLRLVCQMLQDHDDHAAVTSTVGTEGANVELAMKADLVRRSDDREISLARIRARLGNATTTGAPGRASVLLQFKEAALGASRVVFNRVRDFSSGEGVPQRKSIRYFFERLGRSSAA